MADACSSNPSIMTETGVVALGSKCVMTLQGDMEMPLAGVGLDHTSVRYFVVECLPTEVRGEDLLPMTLHYH